MMKVTASSRKDNAQLAAFQNGLVMENATRSASLLIVPWTEVTVMSQTVYQVAHQNGWVMEFATLTA